MYMVFNSLHVGIRCVQLVAKGGQESLHLLTATLTVSLHSPVYIHCMNVIVWGEGNERSINIYPFSKAYMYGNPILCWDSDTHTHTHTLSVTCIRHFQVPAARLQTHRL